MEKIGIKLLSLLLTHSALIGGILGCRTIVNAKQRSLQQPLLHQDSNIVKTSWPSIGCWFWYKDEFEKGGYKQSIDLFEKYSPFKMLTASLRYPGDLTEPRVHDQIKDASQYAKRKGIGVVMDLDVQLTREGFYAKYPNELQQIVLLREFSLNKDSVSIIVKGKGLNDRFTNRRVPRPPVETKLLRVYCYEKEGGSIRSGTVKDISSEVMAISTTDSALVSVKPSKEDKGKTACAIVAVTLFTPDVFAPSLLSYQREILKQYANASLAGAGKDEWGFPGRIVTPTDELWYSPAMAKLYGQQRPGRNLLRDMLLMTFGETNASSERTAAINHYMQMYWQRNTEIETDFYNSVKEILGNDAMVATHPTWFPYPDNREIFKNGLSWWGAKRDVAQTDEATPFSARTALAKKMNSPIWFNMFYDKNIQSYYKEIWRAALAGGRLNYHQSPLNTLPVKPVGAPFTSLLSDSLMMAESRVSLLNYISETAPHCPVVVVFGHPAALNWSDKKHFADVGLSIVNRLWEEGYYTDLIPSSEIENGSLKINANGKIQYGPQEYDVVIYYHPEYDKRNVTSFFQKAGTSSQTLLIQVGDWTKDFEGNSFDGNTLMAESVQKIDSSLVAGYVISALQKKNIPIQTAGEENTTFGFPASIMPKASGQLTLIDGTRIFVSGERHPLGDPIIKRIDIEGIQVDIDAIGIAAVKVSRNGELEALACGGMKSIKVGKFNIDLPERLDIALIKRSSKWKGIIHNSNGVKIPAPLLNITSDWTLVRSPEIFRNPTVAKQ